MKVLNRKKKLTNYHIVAIILSLILCACLCSLIIFISWNNKISNKPSHSDLPLIENTEEATTELIATEVVAPEQEIVSTDPTVLEAELVAYAEVAEQVEFNHGRIITPYLTLCYPEMFEDYLIVTLMNEDPYTLSFYAVMERKNEVRLFDIALLNTAYDDKMNDTAEVDDVSVDMTLYNLNFDDTWSDDEIVTVHAMQDAVNEMIEQLSFEDPDEQLISTEVMDPPDTNLIVDYLKIETPYTVMYYPALWADMVSIEQVEKDENNTYKVNFYCSIDDLDEQMIFSIFFGGDEGEQLGALVDADGVLIPVNLLVYELNLDAWPEEKVQLAYSMQDAANQLVDMLDLLYEEDNG